ncbi:MAG: FAD-binding oxidoreductase [Hyphomicrobiales bacterium]
MSVIDELTERLGEIPIETNAKIVRGKSRDFFWYSPILKEKLDHVVGDAVVSPRSEEEVVQVLAACWALDLPVTPRGGGTGNYAQSMPLAGGVVLDMTRMNKIKSIGDGVLVVEPGALMGDIEKETRSAGGQELRMHPSTRETATIGGFISGGSGGVGSIRWGMLREPGNILRVRLATLEETPQLIDLVGTDINAIHHAYGVNGVITEVEVPLVPAQNWVELIVSFNDWIGCAKTGWEIANHEGLWLKQLAAIQAPAPHNYFARHRKFLQEDDSVLCILAAPNALVPLTKIIEKPGARIAFRSDTASEEDKKGLPHLHHLAWNHTTLRALRAEPEITYLQTGTPQDDPLPALAEIATRFANEIIGHIEFARSAGRVFASFLPMYRFSTQERLNQVVHELEELGCPCYNPHAYTYEEGNRTDPDALKLEMKKRADPKGLLNPGKMIGWENPDYTYDREGGYHYSDLQAPPEDNAG